MSPRVINRFPDLAVLWYRDGVDNHAGHAVRNHPGYCNDGPGPAYLVEAAVHLGTRSPAISSHHPSVSSSVFRRGAPAWAVKKRHAVRSRSEEHHDA